MPSAELRLFISSTFQDLQEEREHLVKKIFPEIRALCRERGITFTEVDLRWGLTHEEGTYGRIIRTCLEEIDRCRPYFIGILGSRYGYVPEFLEIHKDPELLRQHAWIEQAVLDGMSITEMEMRFGVLNDPGAATGARFYLRRERASLEVGGRGQEAERLDALKQSVRASGVSVQEFRDPASLGEMVYDDLIELIRRDFADVKPPTALEQERSRHSAFAASRRHAYIPNAQHLRRLGEWHGSDEPPLVIYAESGSGKSSLVSYWCEQLRRRQPEAFVVEHYVGIGAGDTDHLGLIRHVMQEIKERFGREEELPQTPEEIERGLGQWLGLASHELNKRGERMVLVLDGLNQLTGPSLNLLWIPDVISPEIRLIVTTTVEETLVKLRRRGWRELGMQPLGEAEREAVVVRFLSEYHKTPSVELVRRLSVDAKCAHPLFLRTLLEELRIFGHHEQIDEEARRLLECTGTEDLFQRVLERMEDDYSTRTVRDVMSLIWCSRGGLAEEELAELTGLSRLKLSTMLLGLDYHLVRHEGLVTFFHDYLRRAVQKRYLSEEASRVPVYRKLADYFGRSEITLRTTREVLHAAQGAGDRERVQRVLSEIERFEVLWEADRFEVMAGWAECEGKVVVDAYKESFRQWEQSSPTAVRREIVLTRIGELHEAQGRWQEAEFLALERLRTSPDRVGESRALASLSWLACRLGRFDLAEQRAREAEAIARELNDRRTISLSVGNRGTASYSRGEYDEALACFREQESIARELGDRAGVGRAVGNRGIVHAARGAFDEALDCYAELEALARALGDRRTLGHTIGNRGIVYCQRSQFDEALACYAEQESIARELGDRSCIESAVGGQAVVHDLRGEYDEAIECFEVQEKLARELGDPKCICAALCNRGNVHYHLGEYSEAMECWQRAEAITRDVGDRRGTGVAVGSKGRVHLARGEYVEALECHHEQEAIAREIGDRPGIGWALAQRGHVHCACGEYGEALACYREQEAIARLLRDQESIGTAVGNRGLVHCERGDYTRAVACLRRADAEHRAIGFRYGITYWAVGIARIVIDAVETQDDMPAYLSDVIVAREGEDWRRPALHVARALADEGLALSRELSKQDTLRGASLVLARVDAVEGRIADATRALGALLKDSDDDAERAECLYRLWKISGADDVRVEALRLYQSLVQHMPDDEYRHRVEELSSHDAEVNVP